MLPAGRLNYARFVDDYGDVLAARHDSDKAAAALRSPRLDVEQTVAERGRMRSALLAAGFDCPESHANFVFVPLAA